MRQRGLQPTIYLESAKNLKSLTKLAFAKSANIELATSFPTPSHGPLTTTMNKKSFEPSKIILISFSISLKFVFYIVIKWIKDVRGTFFGEKKSLIHFFVKYTREQRDWLNIEPEATFEARRLFIKKSL